MCVLLHLLICTELRAHIIVVETLYKIYDDYDDDDDDDDDDDYACARILSFSP